MKPGITRRTLSAALLGVPALAQAPPAAAPKPQETAKPAPGEDLRAAASKQIESNVAQLRKFDIPIETEPAFRFKA